MKDFLDLWSLLGNLELDGPTIVKAVGATFGRRGTEIPIATPIGMTEGFAEDHDKLRQWSAFINRIRLPDPPDLSTVVARLGTFALPVFHAASRTAPVPSRWSPAQGWEP